MKKSFISTLLLFLTVCVSANNIYIRPYPYVRTARLKGTPGSITAIPLDPQMYKNTNQDYSNIRIIDKDGRNVPFSVKNVFPLVQKKFYADLPIKIEDYHQNNKTKKAEISIVLNFPARFSRLSFPAQKQFEATQISLNFYDSQNQNIGNDQIFRLNPPDKQSDMINLDFPPVKAKKILISMTVSEEKQLKAAEHFLKKVEVRQQIPVKMPGEPEYTTLSLPEISRFNKGTLTEITVNAQKIPCTELKITCDDKMFSRYAEIFTKDSQGERCIASQTITEKKNIIPLPEVRGNYYIIRIHNAEKAPLKNIRLQWEAKKRVLMFIPPEKGDLKIYYGGNVRQYPYDIEYAERFGLPPQVYELEAEVYSPDYEPQIPTIDLYKYFTWVIILIAAMFFLLTVVRMLNKSRDWDDGKPK